MACSSPLFELLHEHFANDYVILIFEDSTEYNCYTISLCLHIPVTVIMYLEVKYISYYSFYLQLYLKQTTYKNCQLLQGSCPTIHHTTRAALSNGESG